MQLRVASYCQFNNVREFEHVSKGRSFCTLGFNFRRYISCIKRRRKKIKEKKKKNKKKANTSSDAENTLQFSDPFIKTSEQNR